MAKFLNTAALLLCFAATAQQIPQNLSVAVKEGKLPDTIACHNCDYSFYSKNYTAIFGKLNYTTDSFNFGSNNVYVGHDNRFYFSGASVSMDNIPAMNADNYFYSRHGGLLPLVAGIVVLFNATANYNPGKDITEITIYNSDK